MAEPARQRFTLEEYVWLEDMSTVKHEYLAGHVWAMAGGTPDHAAIAANVIALLATQLRGRPCRVFSSDLRVRVKATGLGTYPDATVICGQIEIDPEDPKRQTAVNPRLIIEVLNPSTEAYDRREKLEHYQRIAGLEEIVLVGHDEHRLDVYQREGDGWRHSEYLQGKAVLGRIECELSLDEVYRNPLAAAEH